MDDLKTLIDSIEMGVRLAESGEDPIRPEELVEVLKVILLRFKQLEAQVDIIGSRK